MSDIEVDVTADSGDRWYCEGGCERSYPFSVAREYRAIASDHLITLRVPFCPDCCTFADTGVDPLERPPERESVMLGFDNRHRYWNRWLRSWVLPPVGVPGEDASVDPAATDDPIYPGPVNTASRGPLPPGVVTATEASILGARIVARQEVADPTGFTAELIRRAEAAGYVSLIAYVGALEDQVLMDHARWLRRGTS